MTFLFNNAVITRGPFRNVIAEIRKFDRKCVEDLANGMVKGFEVE